MFTVFPVLPVLSSLSWLSCELYVPPHSSPARHCHDGSNKGVRARSWRRGSVGHHWASPSAPWLPIMAHHCPPAHRPAPPTPSPAITGRGGAPLVAAGGGGSGPEPAIILALVLGYSFPSYPRQPYNLLNIINISLKIIHC